jgi:hypothetical protein
MPRIVFSEDDDSDSKEAADTGNANTDVFGVMGEAREGGAENIEVVGEEVCDDCGKDGIEICIEINAGPKAVPVA